MAKTILIIGESGSGKTTSTRNLDPKTTLYIDCDKKGLSWKGWKDLYNSTNKNYLKTSNIEVINKSLDLVNTSEKYNHIKTVVVDTINGIMIDYEMEHIKDKGYDKWTDLASLVYDTIVKANELRDDLVVIFTGHSQTDRDDLGYMFTRLKTNGKKLDKIVLESKFTTVLLAKKIGGKFIFETQSNNSTAKSPMGAFDTLEIDNDITEVIKALEEY